jgi:hypothetical protein
MAAEYKGEFYFKSPDFDFELAVNDALIFNLYSYRILIFKMDGNWNHHASTEVLKQGLQKLTERCPPLGGKVVSIEHLVEEQHGWKKVIPGPGIKLVVRDLRSELKYADLEAREFPAEALICEQVVPISPAPIMEGEAPGSVFQYTWIDGGALLAVGIDHPITDGNGMNTIMGMLAEECRRAQSGQPSPKTYEPRDATVLGTDRSLIRSLENNAKNSPNYHRSYTFLDQPPLHVEEKIESDPKMDTDMYMFQILPEKLVELKNAASTNGLKISTHDALSALTWRSVMISRYKAGVIKDLDTEVEFHLPTDVRGLLGLDKDYVGNAVYFITCTMRLRELIQPDSLPKAAALIRKQLSARNADLIAGYHSLVKSLADLSQMTFGWIQNVTTTAFAIGSSWKANQMYGADWGSAFGPVMRFRSPDVGFFGVFRGLAFVCPRVQGTGPAEIQMWLEPVGWEALQNDKLFMKFYEKIGR